MSLYPNFKPRGVRRAWDHCSMGVENAGEVLRKRWGTPFGDPIDAVAWFDEDDALRVLVADFANGERAVWRCGGRQSSITYSTRSSPPPQ
jgi:hypothetical protein